MLIQVKNSGKNDKENQTIKDLVRKYKKNIRKNGFKWATYFGDDKNTSSELRNETTLKKLSANNSIYDVIFFKIGPATGWDIPRAAMLVQLRNVCSESLNIQKIGRIKRNQNPRYPFNDNNIVFNYYIYSYNKKPDKNHLIWELKPEFKNEKFLSGYLDLYQTTKNSESLKNKINDETYIKKFKDIFNGHDFLNSFQNYKKK